MNGLIIRPAALGDTLMLLPSLARLGQGAEVTLVGRSPGIHYLRPCVRLCLDFESMGWHTLFTERVDLPDPPPAEVVVAFLRNGGSLLKENLEARFPGSRVHIFPGVPAEGEPVHAALHLARCLEISGLAGDPEGCLREAGRQPLLRSGSLRKSEAILFHPGSGGRAKNHPPDFWLNLMRTMGEDPAFQGFRRCVLLGPAEEGLLPFFQKAGSGGLELILSPHPDDLLRLLDDSALFLGQDSGVTHLAAMAGVPTIALFRVDNAAVWRPLGPRVAVVLGQGAGEELASEVRETAARLLGGA